MEVSGLSSNTWLADSYTKQSGVHNERNYWKKHNAVNFQSGLTDIYVYWSGLFWMVSIYLDLN